MDHEMAVRLQSSEKYLLGELSPAERDQFEEHLADCSRCMDEFWTTDVFAANARAVFEDRAAGRVQRKAYSWLDWFRLKPLPTLAFSGALNLALLGLVSYGTLRVLPRVQMLENPGSAYSFGVRGLSRGSVQTFTVPAGAGYANPRFDLVHAYRQYSYTIESATNAGFKRSGALTPVPGSDTLDVIIPVAGLKAGEYKLIVTGSDGNASEEIGRCVLNVSPKN
jgi:Putative zinc-finger